MIKAIAQTPEGVYMVDMELNSEQHQFILDAGLSFLLQMGALPLAQQEPGEDLPKKVLN